MIRIKNENYNELPESFFYIDHEEWGLEFISCYPIGRKIIDATFKIVDMKKYVLFLIKYPVRIYPI